MIACHHMIRELELPFPWWSPRVTLQCGPQVLGNLRGVWRWVLENIQVCCLHSLPCNFVWFWVVATPHHCQKKDTPRGDSQSPPPLRPGKKRSCRRVLLLIVVVFVVFNKCHFDKRGMSHLRYTVYSKHSKLCHLWLKRYNWSSDVWWSCDAIDFLVDPHC